MSPSPATPTRTLFVGAPMWANRNWVGRHLPADTPSGTELGAYSRLLNAVEGNTTFYADPAPALVARWASLIAPPFRMVVKAPREITHERRLREVDDRLASFVDLLAPLADALGGVMLQLPPSFGPGDIDALAATAARLRRDVAWSVEVRHPDFCGGPAMASLHRVLERHGMERVVLDTTALFAHPPRTPEGRDEWRSKPRLPVLATALTDRPIVRFVGGDDDARADRGIRNWEETLATWITEGRSPTFFVHSPDNTDSPRAARALHDRLRATIAGLESLPDPLPVATAEQGLLF